MTYFSIKGRLVVMVGVLLALLVLSAGFGIINSQRASATLGALYNDRVVPLKQLKEVADGYAVGIVDAAHKVRDGGFTAAEGTKAVSEARVSIDKAWRAHVGTELLDQEKALIAKAEGLFKRANGAADTLAGLMKANDIEGLRAFAAKDMYPAIDPLADVISALIQVQLDVAAADYRASVATASRVLWSSVVGIAVALAIGVLMAWTIIRSIVVPLGKAVSLAQAVAAGDLSTRIESSSSDETGRLLDALRTMNDNLSSIVGQVRDCAESVASGSTQISNGNFDLSQRTEEQAANLEQTAASMEELTATVKQNAEPRVLRLNWRRRHHARRRRAVAPCSRSCRRWSR